MNSHNNFAAPSANHTVTQNMSHQLTENVCVICRGQLTDQTDVSVVSRGRTTLIDFSSKYGDNDLLNYLTSNPAVVKVHNECRKNFTSKHRLEQVQKRPHAAINTESETVQTKSLRSSCSAFDWKSHCFFCGEQCVTDERHRDRRDSRCVQTLELREYVLEKCAERLFVCESDDVALAVKSRLGMCCDLVAEEAVYHRKCYTAFFASTIFQKAGRPVDASKEEAFEKLCTWLEDGDSELLTLAELSDVAKSITGISEVYSEKWLKMKLVERYGEHIVFAEVDGRKNVICWRKMASFIVNEEWYNRRKQQTDDSERIVVTAARLIKFAVREMECDMGTYPSSSMLKTVDSAAEWIPSLLRMFSDNLVSADIKKVALGHSIVQAVRPKSVIAPLLFGLGISLDHLVGSKLAINILSRLGFSCSYDEIIRFKQSVVQSDDDAPLLSSRDEFFTQFAGDNVDHNICTLDGSHTFHGMGVISMSTPCSFGEVPIRRLSRCTVSRLIRNKGIPLFSYVPEKSVLNAILFQSSQRLQCLCDQQAAKLGLDERILWHAGWFVKDADNPRLPWSGFMHNLYQSSLNSPVQPVHSAVIQMHPIIDENPNELSTIYSTLMFVDQQAKQFGIQTTCITFDQPLWIKAVGIILSEKLNIVCRLGPFHVLMSFLCSIGSLMNGSGLTEALQCCYGTNAVRHMLSGKAVKRAIRGHYLVDSALKVVLLRKYLMQPEDVDDLKKLYDDVEKHRTPLSELQQSQILCKLRTWLKDEQTKLAQSSRTANLWLHYMEYVDIIKTFIQAERLGNWDLHLQCVASMMNLFAATGHHNYAKPVFRDDGTVA